MGVFKVYVFTGYSGYTGYVLYFSYEMHPRPLFHADKKRVDKFHFCLHNIQKTFSGGETP